MPPPDEGFVSPQHEAAAMVAEILATDSERLKNVVLFQGTTFSLINCIYLDGARLTKLRIEVHRENF